MLLQKKLIKKEALYFIGLLISTIDGGHGMQPSTDDISYDPNRKMIYRGKNLDNVNRPQMAPLPIRRTENMVEYELMLAVCRFDASVANHKKECVNAFELYRR